MSEAECNLFEIARSYSHQHVLDTACMNKEGARIQTLGSCLSVNVFHSHTKHNFLYWFNNYRILSCTNSMLIVLRYILRLLDNDISNKDLYQTACVATVLMVEFSLAKPTGAEPC